jgi:2,3-dihydroxybenzoate decarboxylase
MVKKIALEEHVMFPGMREYWEPTVKDLDKAMYDRVLARLTDFSGERLELMDKSGIEMAVLSLAGPGVQLEPDTAKAIAKAREANDALAAETMKRPNRYLGFAHVALQDPVGAANELERCVRDFKFVGAMVNGHTNGQYLDDPALAPFWERAEALDVPIYLHPADPVTPYVAYAGYKALSRATWGWTVETGTHALRMVFGGLFDRHPKAKLVLGHMGETLPYQLWRFDSRAKLYGAKLGMAPSEYIRRNIYVTVSGMYSAEPLNCAIAALGVERVMFAADYPFETMSEAGEFMDDVPLDASQRDSVAWGNAAKLFRIG